MSGVSLWMTRHMESVRRKSNRLRQRPLREDFLRRKGSAYSHGRILLYKEEVYVSGQFPCDLL